MKRLSEVAEILAGFAFKSKDFSTDTGEFVIKIKDIVPPNIIIDSASRVSLESYKPDRIGRFKLKKGDYVVAMTGATIGKVGLLKDDVIAYLNQRVAKICGKEITDSKYIYFAISGEAFRLFIQNNIDSHSAQENISSTSIGRFELPWPDSEKRQAIAEVLSSIDDKIDLLNRQNETLEAMAQTLFRQWFIEEADDSWEEVELGELVETTTGISYKSSNLSASNIHMLNLKSFNRDGSIRLDGYKEFQGDFKEKHTCTNGDILVAHTDVTQDASLLGNAIEVINLYGADKMIYSMDLVKVIPIDNTNRKFILYTLKCGGFKEHAISMSNGSTVLHLSKKALPTFHIKLPPKELRLLFNEYASSIQARITSNYHSMRSLMTLRDTLLPKLMSGEVRVKLD